LISSAKAQDIFKVEWNGNYEEDPWWNSTWKYKKYIQIYNLQNPENLTDYQILINLPYDIKMQPDFSDIRFTWYNSTDGTEIEIPYWIESYTSQNANIWIKVPFIPALGTTDVYVYYGNTTPVSSTSNPYNVFILYEDFEGGLGNWTQEVGSWSVTTCPQRSTKKCVNVKRNDAALKHNSVQITNGTTIIYEGYESYSSLQNGVAIGIADSLVGSNLYIYGMSPGSNRWWYFWINHIFNGTDLGIIWGGFWWRGNLSMAKTPYSQSGIYIYSSDQSQILTLQQTINGTYPLRIVTIGDGFGVDYYVDDIIILSYTPIQPTYSIGMEETLPLPSITIFSPLNQSYYGSIDFVFVFKVIDYLDENFTVKAYLNNQLEYENLYYQNNTQISYSKSLPMGTYNFTVYAEDSYGAYSQQEVIFTSLGYCGDNVCQADYENNMNCFKDCGGTARQFTVGIGSVVLAFGGLMLLATAFASSPTEGKDYVFKIFIAVIGIILMVYGIIYLFNL
jgi:hypothetical protein